MKPFPIAARTLAAALLSAALLPSAAFAQELASGPVVAPNSTVLTVSAEGRTDRAPDLAVFSAGVASTGKTAGEALAKNSTDMARVIAALKRAGIADRDIQTSNLSINPVYADPNREPRPIDEQIAPRVIGYQANNSVTVRQRRLEDFGKVIDTLVSAGANQVNGPSFMVDNQDSALDAARVAAMKKARERANLYAGAAGLRVVRILTIAESGGYSAPPRVFYSRAMDAAAPAPPVEAGEVSLTSSVTVSFELAP